MTTFETRIQKLANIHGAEFINDKDGKVYELWLPCNEKWIESGCRVICHRYGNDSQSWKLDAYRELVESAATGKVYK